MANNEKCSNCKTELNPFTHITSFFTGVRICQDCKHKEDVLIATITKCGVDINRLENCGYMPKANGKRKTL